MSDFKFEHHVQPLVLYIYQLCIAGRVWSGKTIQHIKTFNSSTQHGVGYDNPNYATCRKDGLH